MRIPASTAVVNPARTRIKRFIASSPIERILPRFLVHVKAGRELTVLTCHPEVGGLRGCIVAYAETGQSGVEVNYSLLVAKGRGIRIGGLGRIKIADGWQPLVDIYDGALLDRTSVSDARLAW